MHYNSDALIMCLHPLGPTPHLPYNFIDLLFNAQTSGSLIVPGYFLGFLLSPAEISEEKKQSEMSWRKKLISSINLESGSFLSNETVDELFGRVLSKTVSARQKWHFGPVGSCSG